MKNRKLNLTSLSVKSFTTRVESQEEVALKGGNLSINSMCARCTTQCVLDFPTANCG